MTLQEMITAVQKSLGVTVDGKAGPETWNAIYKKIVMPDVAGEKEALDISPVDSRSEKNISSLDPKIQSFARTLVHKAASVGITIKVISGLRT